MRRILIGDIHGRDVWKKIVENETFDEVIFVGDYFDSYDIPGLIQIQNFLDIINFKKNTDKQVILLVGNHDYHYFPEINSTNTSGYQHQMAVTIKHTIMNNREHLQMVYQFNDGEDVLVSHAGISPVWLKKYGWSNEPVVDFVNDLFKYKPLAFEFDGDNPYGNSSGQTPIWIRPDWLKRDCKKEFKKQYIQVVGHTGQNTIDIKGKTTGGRYYFIDTLPTEYLIVDNGRFIKGIVEND